MKNDNACSLYWIKYLEDKKIDFVGLPRVTTEPRVATPRVKTSKRMSTMATVVQKWAIYKRICDKEGVWVMFFQ